MPETSLTISGKPDDDLLRWIADELPPRLQRNVHAQVINSSAAGNGFGDITRLDLGHQKS